MRYEIFGGARDRAIPLPRPARLALRPFAPADEAVMAALLADPLLAADVEAIDIGPDDQRLAIVATDTGLVVGQGIIGRPADARAPTSVALWLDATEWGKGLGTEALQALVDLAFADRRTGALWCEIAVANGRARRMLEKSGFQYRGSGAAQAGADDPRARERYVLDRGSWTSLKAWGAASVTAPAAA